MSDIEQKIFQKRVIALLIDWIIIFIVYFIIENIGDSFASKNITLKKTIGASYMFFPIFYYCFFHGKWGATIGKMVVGLRVVGVNGLKISYIHSITRYSVYTAALLFVFFTTLFSPVTESMFDKYNSMAKQLEQAGITEEKITKGLLTESETQRLEILKKEFENDLNKIGAQEYMQTVSFGSFLYTVFGLADILFFFISGRRRALHDIIAKTYVVDIRT